MELDYGLNAAVTLGVTPGLIGQPASVEVWIDRDVVAKAFGRREERLELDLLHGPLALLPALDLADGLEDFIVRERCEFLRDLREPLERLECFDRVHGLEQIPEFPDSRLHRIASLWERQYAHHLGAIGIGGCADEQAARKIAILIRVPAQ